LSISFLSGGRGEREDRELRADSCAGLAENATVGDDDGVVVALCVELARDSEHVNRAVLDAELAALAALDAYMNAASHRPRLGQDRRAAAQDLGRFTSGRSG
jgi:hypothetical protein